MLDISLLDNNREACDTRDRTQSLIDRPQTVRFLSVVNSRLRSLSTDYLCLRRENLVELWKVDKFSSDKLIGFLAKLGFRFKPIYQSAKGNKSPVQCQIKKEAA